MKNKNIYFGKIIYNDIELNYTYEIKETRSIRITFYNKNLHLYVGKYFTINEVNNFLKKHFEKIYQKYLSYKKYFFSIEKKELYIFNERYEIEFIKNLNKNFIILKDQKKVLIKEYKSNKTKINIIYKIYEDVLTNYVNLLINEKYYKYIKDFEIEYVYSKTFFGRCFYKENKIQLNYLLCKFDPIYLNSTLVHELAHIYEKNHHRNFYKRMKEIDNNVFLDNKELILVKKEEV